MDTESGQHTEAGYAYSNRSDQAAAHHDALAKLFDRNSIRYVVRHFPQRNLGGARVLVPGAGGGSLVEALANVVGPGGLITATDLHPDLLPTTLPNVQVLQHDLNDELPPGPYDLIIARLILSHLPARKRILTGMIGALKPGGMLIVEDFDPMPADRFVASAPTLEVAELVRRVQVAHRLVLDAHGNDPTWALRAHGLMVAGGLTRVHSQSFAESWHGRGPGATLMASTLAQVRNELVGIRVGGHQLAAADVNDVISALAYDPRLVLHGHRMVTTSGIKGEAPHSRRPL